MVLHVIVWYWFLLFCIVWRCTIVMVLHRISLYCMIFYFVQALLHGITWCYKMLYGAIHSKSEQIGGDLLLNTEKLAEKVRISGRQNFAINVRLS